MNDKKRFSEMLSSLPNDIHKTIKISLGGTWDEQRCPGTIYYHFTHNDKEYTIRPASSLPICDVWVDYKNSTYGGSYFSLFGIGWKAMKIVRQYERHIKYVNKQRSLGALK